MLRKDKMNESAIKSYLKLLEIRHRAARRNTFIIGTVFIICLLAFFALGMISRIRGLELYVISSVLIAIALGFISSLIRLETIKAVSEFGHKLIQNEVNHSKT
jgi:hypothetical protein